MRGRWRKDCREGGRMGGRETGGRGKVEVRGKEVKENISVAQIKRFRERVLPHLNGAECDGGVCESLRLLRDGRLRFLLGSWEWLLRFSHLKPF